MHILLKYSAGYLLRLNQRNTGNGGLVLAILILFGCSLSKPVPESATTLIKINPGARIVLIGNNLGSRMMNYGHFETELHLRYPDYNLFIRKMCDGGNTPGFRPHASQVSPWAFLGAEKFQTELNTYSDSEGHFETEDQWLTNLKADVIIAFFGYNESFAGPVGLETRVLLPWRVVTAAPYGK